MDALTSERDKALAAARALDRLEVDQSGRKRD
jgi:hypothetical protein